MTLGSVKSSMRDDEGATAVGGEDGGSDEGNFGGATNAEAAGDVDFLGQQKRWAPHVLYLVFTNVERNPPRDRLTFPNTKDPFETTSLHQTQLSFTNLIIE
jgi:hypothetical protein